MGITNAESGLAAGSVGMPCMAKSGVEWAAALGLPRSGKLNLGGGACLADRDGKPAPSATASKVAITSTNL